MEPGLVMQAMQTPGEISLTKLLKWLQIDNAHCQENML